MSRNHLIIALFNITICRLIYYNMIIDQQFKKNKDALITFHPIFYKIYFFNKFIIRTAGNLGDIYKIS